MNPRSQKILLRLLVAFPAAAVVVCGILDMRGQDVLGAAAVAAVAAYLIGMFVILIGDMIRSQTEHRAALRQKHRLCVNCGYDLRATVSRCPECGTPVVAASIPTPKPTPTLTRAETRAAELSKQLGCDYVGSEHLLLALLEESGGAATCVLGNLGITAADVREQLTGMGLGVPPPFAQAIAPEPSVATSPTPMPPPSPLANDSARVVRTVE